MVPQHDERGAVRQQIGTALIRDTQCVRHPDTGADVVAPRGWLGAGIAPEPELTHVRAAAVIA